MLLALVAFMYVLEHLISLGTMILVLQVMRADSMDSISLCGQNGNLLAGSSCHKEILC